MTPAIFGLACLAALNPKLLAADLIFMGNRRPRLMFGCFLLGGMGMALAVGLLDVLVLQASAISVEGNGSAGLDLALGIPLLTVGILLLTGHLPGPRRPALPPGRREGKASAWARRVLREPRPALVIAIGLLAGTPGVSYLAALNMLVTGNSPVDEQVVAVVSFVVIEFSLVIVPFAALLVRPGGTEQAVERVRDWLASHARQIVGGAAVFAGGYMVISGLLRLG